MPPVPENAADAPNAVPSIADTPSEHGFVLAGTGTLYLSHLPMFSVVNHRYQLILEIGLPAYARDAYLTDRAQSSGQLYILGNVAADLFTVPQVHNREVVSFLADVFRGLPQDPDKDKPLLHNVRVSVERVVYFRCLDDHQEYPAALTYVLFGAGGEAHLAHVMIRKPDFDQVVDLEEAPEWLPPQQLESSVLITFPGLSGRVPPEKDPLTEASYTIEYQAFGAQFPLRIGNNLWFDTSSLNV